MLPLETANGMEMTVVCPMRPWTRKGIRLRNLSDECALINLDVQNWNNVDLDTLCSQGTMGGQRFAETLSVKIQRGAP